MRVAYGINPQGGGMNPFDEELGETITICHGAGVMQSFGNGIIFPRDVCGTLCARDCIKTGPRTPSGQDAHDHKLIVQTLHRPCSVRRDSSRRGGIL